MHTEVESFLWYICKFWTNIFKSSTTGTQQMKRSNSTGNTMSLLRHSLLINMPFTNKDKLSIKLLRQEKVQNVFPEFSNKNWAVSSVRDLLLKIHTTNSICQPRTVRVKQNIERIAELIWSQEDNPGSSKSPRYIKTPRLFLKCRPIFKILSPGDS